MITGLPGSALREPHVNIDLVHLKCYQDTGSCTVVAARASVCECEVHYDTRGCPPCLIPKSLPRLGVTLAHFIDC